MDDKLAYLKGIQLIRERIRMEELEYLFKHALAQEAAYESTLFAATKELHLKVAEAIERIFKDRLHEFYGILALHYNRADNVEKAEEYMVKAGEEALRSSASSVKPLITFSKGCNCTLTNMAKPRIRKNWQYFTRISRSLISVGENTKMQYIISTKFS